MSSTATPIVIGVGDIKNRSQKVEDALEPMELMLRAIKLALQDTSLSSSALFKLQSQIDDLSVVRTWTWPYPDLPTLLSSELGADPEHKVYSDHGGNQPAKLFDEAARRISRRESKVAVVTGGEALASLGAFAAAGQMPPPSWTKLPQEVTEVFSASNRDLGTSTPTPYLLPPPADYKAPTYTATDLGAVHGIGVPLQIYPLYENGFRAYRGQSVTDNNAESAKLYGEFAKVAENNEFAWNYGKKETEASIGTVGKKNRMICWPYPLLMNAFNNINLAGAIILTSTEHARELGVPESKWIYPLGGAGTRDSDEFWLRPNFHSSPSISASLDAGLAVCNLTKAHIDIYDFYSCFPIVPKLACAHLGLSIAAPAKPITLLGGLTSFGGAGNNYSMHAITALVRHLRESSRGQNGLVLANGGSLTYQHVVILSNSPGSSSSSYPSRPPLPESLTTRAPFPPAIATSPRGTAVIETYTVSFSRDGKPETAFIVGRLKESGDRFVANEADEETLDELGGGGEMIGRWGWVSQEMAGERNLFSFKRGEKGKL